MTEQIPDQIDMMGADELRRELRSVLCEGKNREEAAFLAGWSAYNGSRWATGKLAYKHWQKGRVSEEPPQDDGGGKDAIIEAAQHLYWNHASSEGGMVDPGSELWTKLRDALFPVSEERDLADTVRERVADPKLVDVDLKDL